MFRFVECYGRPLLSSSTFVACEQPPTDIFITAFCGRAPARDKCCNLQHLSPASSLLQVFLFLLFCGRAYPKHSLRERGMLLARDTCCNLQHLSPAGSLLPIFLLLLFCGRAYPKHSLRERGMLLARDRCCKLQHLSPASSLLQFFIKI